MKRCDFTNALITGFSGVFLLPNLLSGCEYVSDAPFTLGFIGGIVKKQIKAGQDWQSVFEKAVQLGYTNYEGPHFGDSSSKFLDHLENLGLNYLAGPVSISESEQQILQELDYLVQVGASFACCYWPWFVSGPFTLEDCKRSAEALNRIGKWCQERNLQLCWHNHDKEFLPLNGGTTPFEYLLSHTDEDLVKVELDLYWVAKGGENPKAIIAKLKNRIQLLHVKDRNPTTNDKACVGRGNLDFKGILAEARKYDIKHLIIERDGAVDGLECLKNAHAYLKPIIN